MSRLFSLGGGLILGTLIVFMAVGVLPCPKPAQAYTPTGVDAMAMDMVDKVSNASKYGDIDTRTRAQRVLTRSARAAYSKPVAGAGTSITTGLVRGGLLGAATGIWIHNGIMIYNGFQCGRPDCPDAIKLDAQFMRSSDPAAKHMYGYWGKYGYYEGISPESAGGNVTGAVVITGVDYSSASKTATFTYETTGAVPGAYLSVPTYGGTCSNRGGLQNPSSVNFSGSPQKVTISVSTTVGAVVFAWNAGPLGCTAPGEDFSINNPVFDVGEVTYQPIPEYTPADGDYVPSASQNEEFVNRIASDPEFLPEWEPTPVEPAPQQEPTITRENEDGSITKVYPDGTEVTTWPDGTTVTRSPGGTVRTENPDGTIITESPDGTVVTELPNGTTITQRPNGTSIIQYPDGTTNTQRPGEPDQWTDPTGKPIPPPDATTYPPVTPVPPAHPAPPPVEGATNQGGDSCAKPKQPTLDLPDLNLGSIFPFSLILWLWTALGQLAGDPVAPQFDLGFFGVLNLGGTWAPIIGAIRTCLGLVMICGMLLWFYKSITGRGGEA